MESKTVCLKQDTSRQQQATVTELSEKQVTEIEKLRQDGEEAHKTGKHKESVKILQDALAKLNI